MQQCGYYPYMPQIITKPRHVHVSPNTSLMLKTVVSNRKKGYIFEGETGDPLTKRFMQHQIDKYARLLSLQKLRRYSDDGRRGIATQAPRAEYFGSCRRVAPGKCGNRSINMPKVQDVLKHRFSQTA